LPILAICTVFSRLPVLSRSTILTILPWSACEIGREKFILKCAVGSYQATRNQPGGPGNPGCPSLPSFPSTPSLPSLPSVPGGPNEEEKCEVLYEQSHIENTPGGPATPGWPSCPSCPSFPFVPGGPLHKKKDLIIQLIFFRF
jgi:hypothetical protein